MNPDKENTSFESHAPEATEILEIIEIMSPEDSPMPFPILELFCRSAGKDYDDKVIRSFMGNEKYYPNLKNPEYDENARFREIYVHDSSFDSVGVMAGSKIRIDTRRKPRKGIICVQIADLPPFLTIAKQHKDDMIFGFLNKNFAWFSCPADKVDSIVNFIGVPVDD